MAKELFLNRRRFLSGTALGMAAFHTPGLFAEMLTRTPRQTEGPFYPTKLPLDTDNDLIILNDSLTPAVGEITHLTGRVLSESGEPVRNAVVEIWQADANGVYLHPGSDNREKLDQNFQGFGRFLTSSSGEYYFRTIKPVPYTFRTPHIHVAVLKGGKRMLTTQLYVKGHPLNERDGIFRALPDEKSRELLLVDFQPLEGAGTGELTARFDIVIGQTPEDAEERRGRRRSG